MSFPYMPLYTGSYFKKTRRLTTEQHGAFLLILMEMWNHEGELPSCPDHLAAVALVPKKKWPAIWQALEPLFLFGGGIIRNERMDEELEKAAELTLKRRNAGRKGGYRTAMKFSSPATAEPQQRHSRSESQSDLTTTARVEGRRGEVIDILQAATRASKKSAERE